MRLTRLFVAHLILVFSFWPALAQTAARNEPVAGGGSISGRVTGSGKPLVDVAVGIWRQPDVEPNAGNVAAVGRTDRDGTYELKAPAGKYFIAVRAEGFVVGNENEPVSKSLRPVALLKGSSLKVDFELAPAAAFEGAVTDDLGQPVPLAPIWLMPEGTPAASIPLRYSASIRTIFWEDTGSMDCRPAVTESLPVIWLQFGTPSLAGFRTVAPFILMQPINRKRK